MGYAGFEPETPCRVNFRVLHSLFRRVPACLNPVASDDHCQLIIQTEGWLLFLFSSLTLVQQALPAAAWSIRTPEDATRDGTPKSHLKFLSFEFPERKDSSLGYL
jgi:hypothetical protein